MEELSELLERKRQLPQSPSPLHTARTVGSVGFVPLPRQESNGQPQQVTEEGTYAAPMRPKASRQASARTVGTQSLRAGPSHQRLAEVFLQAVRDIGRHRCPSEFELSVAKEYLEWLEQKTREDHVRSVDELATKVPTQFNEEIRKLQRAEDLLSAAASGKVDKVKRDLEEKWDLMYAVDRNGRTPLHSAACVDQCEVLELLLQKGLKVDTQDYEGYTALHWAVENNAANAVGVLLDHNANVFLRTNGGLTVFDLENDPTQTKEAEIISGYLKQARERSAPAGASRPKSVASPIPNRD